jgi:type VI secretion system protein ImpB
MSGSTQAKVGRVRPPRVQITYDVEDYGQPKKIELPFVIGVLGDFKGDLRKDEELPALKDKSRRFFEITPDTFGPTMAALKPYLHLVVENKLSDSAQTGKLVVDLDFAKDAAAEGVRVFDPANVARQVPELRKLLELREQLASLKSKVQGKDKFDKLLRDLLADVASDAEKRKQLTAELGSVGGESV